MIRSRWWAIAVGAITVVCAAVIALSVPAGPRAFAGYGLLAAFVIVWVTIGRCAHEGDRWAVLFAVLVIVITGGLVAVYPSLAIFQAIAMPSLWASAGTRRGGVLANIGIVLAVSAGFYVALGPSPDTFFTVLLSESASLGGSVALGLWIWRIAELSDERQALIEQLTAAQDELASLHRDAGVTAERERLARELHDTIAQSLAGVVLLAQRSRRELAAGTLTDDGLGLVEDSARAALTETRALVAGGAPVELGGGIEAALDTLAQRFRRETGVGVEVRVGLDAPLDREAEVVALRCAQEGLANVRKHSGASTAAVSLDDEGSTVVLRVRDDGTGFDSGAARDGFGLSGLRDRLALAGGSLEIDGTAGRTTITARIPRSAA